MYLAELRKITEDTKDMPDDTSVIIMNTQDGDTHFIEDISVNRDVSVVYMEASF